MAEGSTSTQGSERVLTEAREEFRRALLQSHERHDRVGELEAAAARFCQTLRREGQPPERMLIDAKRVIEETIDGDDAPVAERAILSCIQHYYRT
jgi:hypothetical protein